MKKFTLSLAVAAVAVLGFGGVADAAYPPPEQIVTVSDSSPAVGGTITATANCAGDETVTFTLGDQTETTTCSEGTANVQLTVGNDPGTIVLGVSGGDSGDLGTTEIVIEGASAPATPVDGLPATGSDGIGLTTSIAAGVLLVGLALFAAATLRRRQPSAA